MKKKNRNKILKLSFFITMAVLVVVLSFIVDDNKLTNKRTLYIYKLSNTSINNKTGIVTKYNYFQGFNKEKDEELVGKYICDDDCEYIDYDGNLLLFKSNGYIYSYNKQLDVKKRLDFNFVVNNIIVSKNGFIVTDGNNRVGYYDFDLKNIVENKYDELYFVNSLDNKIVGSIREEKTDILDINNGNLVKSYKYFPTIYNYKVVNTNYYFDNPFKYNNNKIYDSNLNEILKLEDYDSIINSDQSITVLNSNDRTKFYIYDLNGNKVRESKTYKEVIKIVKDYILVLTNENKINLIDYKENLLNTYLELNTETINNNLCGYDLKKENIVIVLSLKSNKKDKEYYYNVKTYTEEKD